MTTLAHPYSFTAGTTITASEVNANFQATRTWANGGNVVDAARVRDTSGISVPNNTLTVLTFNTERFDTNNLHSTVSNTNRLTCVTTGLYLIVANLTYDAAATGIRECSLRVNGGAGVVVGQQRVAASAAVEAISLTTTALYALTAGDWVETYAFQNSGGPVLVSPTIPPEFSMTYIGRVT